MSESMESLKKFKTLLRQKFGVRAESSEVEAEDCVSGQDLYKRPRSRKRGLKEMYGFSFFYINRLCYLINRKENYED